MESDNPTSDNSYTEICSVSKLKQQVIIPRSEAGKQGVFSAKKGVWKQNKDLQMIKIRSHFVYLTERKYKRLFFKDDHHNINVKF